MRAEQLAGFPPQIAGTTQLRGIPPGFVVPNPLKPSANSGDHHESVLGSQLAGVLKRPSPVLLDPIGVGDHELCQTPLAFKKANHNPFDLRPQGHLSRVSREGCRDQGRTSRQGCVDFALVPHPEGWRDAGHVVGCRLAILAPRPTYPPWDCSW